MAHSSDHARSPKPAECTRQDLEDQLRSALLQIEKSSAHLPNRCGCTFAMHVEAHEHTTDHLEHEQVRRNARQV